MDLVRQERPAGGGGRGGGVLLAGQLQAQLRVRVLLLAVSPQPLQHLLAGEGTGGQAEDPVKLLLKLQALILSGGEITEQGLDVDVTGKLPLLRYKDGDKSVLTESFFHSFIV